MRELLVVMLASYASARLWPQGVVHYAINSKDYDLHSQDVIMNTFARIQQEVCVKFFNSPTNYTASPATKILYISNPDKLKDCPPHKFDYLKSVVDMPIGYRCIDQTNISRIVVDMLRASIQDTASPINSFELTKKFRQWTDAGPRTTLLSPEDRNHLNIHYFMECGSLTQLSGVRRSGDEVQESTQLSEDNLAFYKKLLWPLGVVLYGVHPNIAPDDPALIEVQRAMTTIELHSCVVFQPVPPPDHLESRSFLWFGLEGEELPALGFQTGNQTLSLRALVTGAPAHAAHALHALLRALGVPMASNRHDRDSYVRVDWSRIVPGKEHYLERAPAAAWIRQLPYDLASASHAPANYMCRDCADPLRALTVLPLQDHLWQHTLTMGRRTDLSETDKKLLAILYGRECHARFLKDRK